jgi:putative addiction module component (TIGR02574 family)
MSLQFDQVATQALALSEDERLLLAERLWASVPTDENDEELFAEIAQREADLEAGLVKEIPFEQAMREIRESLKAKR